MTGNAYWFGGKNTFDCLVIDFSVLYAQCNLFAQVSKDPDYVVTHLCSVVCLRKVWLSLPVGVLSALTSAWTGLHEREFWNLWMEIYFRSFVRNNHIVPFPGDHIFNYNINELESELWEIKLPVFFFNFVLALTKRFTYQ